MLFCSRGGMMVSASLSLPPACPPWQSCELMRREKAREKEKKTMYTETWKTWNGGCLPDTSRWWTRGTVSQSLPALKWQFIRTTYAGIYFTVSLLRVAGRVTRPSLTKIRGQFEYDGLTLDDWLTDRRIYSLVVWEFGVKDSTDFRTVPSHLRPSCMLSALTASFAPAVFNTQQKAVIK